jgi:catechol 2,3-dioxygenase-like lactoylglutathione lyase family enzyme
MPPSLSRIIVFVGNPEACGDFYGKHFGFRRVEETFQPAMWCEVEVGGGVTVAFHQAFRPEGPFTGPTGSPENPHKLCFAVDDLPAERQRLLAEGVRMLELSKEGERCDGLDGEDHRFQLVQRR